MSSATARDVRGRDPLRPLNVCEPSFACAQGRTRSALSPSSAGLHPAWPQLVCAGFVAMTTHDAARAHTMAAPSAGNELQNGRPEWSTFLDQQTESPVWLRSGGVADAAVGGEVLDGAVGAGGYAMLDQTENSGPLSSFSPLATIQETA